MAAIAATSYATPSAQAWQGRARLDQARRQADQAETNARELRSQADQAELEAQKGQENVRSVSAQVAQADSTYSGQLRKLVASRTSRQVQSLLSEVASAASTPPLVTAKSFKATNAPWPYATPGNTSGRLVDLSV